jgi:hypothetical protein
MNRFFNSRHMALVEDVRFRIRVRGEKSRASRKLLVVSTHGLGPDELEELRKNYLDSFGRAHVSFPLKERAKHLLTRIDSRVFNFGRFVVNWLPQFRRKSYQVPRSRVLEVVLRLSGQEDARLQEYLGNILRSRSATIGKFRMEGHQYTNGLLDDNVTLKGGHNCSSWIATAPLGEKQALLELLGGDRALEIGTNPGWWTNWLAATASDERVPVILHWTHEPLGQALAKIQPGENFSWDFNRH